MDRLQAATYAITISAGGWYILGVEEFTKICLTIALSLWIIIVFRTKKEEQEA